MKKFDEERLLEEYTEKAPTGLDEAMKLDRKAKLGPSVFTYCYGIVSALVLGVGMCLAMGVIGGGSVPMIVVGVIVGILGIAGVATNYPIYASYLKRNKRKYSSAILLALNRK